MSRRPPHEILERPSSFVAPDLSPTGLLLRPEQLGETTYALLANRPPKDNNGVIIGSQAALVVDAGITPAIGAQIQSAVADLTDRPIRYVTNTTYHGDHTFGNSAFGDDVTILSSRANRDCMDDLDHEKHARSESMFGDPSLRTVVSWRRPDIVFDHYLEVDLGDVRAELWHFGPGNGPGDVLVHSRTEGVVWTGNFLVPAGMVPMVLTGDPWTYAESVRAATEQLDAERLVPGHGFIAPFRPAAEWMLDYLTTLGERASTAFRQGKDVDTVMEEFVLSHPGSDDTARTLNESFHRLNILTTFRWLGHAT